MQISISNVIGRAANLITYAARLIKEFKTRVATYPGSVFEAQACLTNTLNTISRIDLLNDASLVITPNAYNETKLYSVVPNTTLGDMDVVRATTATRVNELGLIEVVPYNLVTYSNTFTSWESMGSVTITANATTSPSGKTDAYLLKSNTNQSDRIQKSLSLTGKLTQSAYIKYAGYNVTVRLTNNLANSDLYVNVTSTSVTLNSVGSAVSNYSITPVGDGWYQITRTSEGFNYFQFWIDFSSNKGGVYAYGFQVNEGDIKDYLPTTTRLNIPRIDYTNGTCPSLLVEPQRTNIYINSSSFTGSYQGGNVITSSETSPLDGINYLKFSEDTTTGQHHFERTLTALANTTYTMSIFAKKAERDILILRAANSTFSSTYVTATFNLTTGVATNGIMIPYQNGYRCIATFTTLTDTILRIRYNIDIISNYNGISGYGLYVTGAQLESGSYVTSYIPTVASTVTRNADVISKTGVSSLIGQTEGTLFVDFNLTKLAEQKGIAIIDNGSNDEYIALTRRTSNIFRLSIKKTGSSAVNIIDSIAINDARCKIGIAYKNGDYAMYVNGILRGTSTNSTDFPTTTLNQFVLSNTSYGFLNDSYNSAQLYKTRLSNSELQSLSTL